ncbi:MAG: type IV toxin-antitoxin system AbiEi family antitoxin domain-containing protein [Desulfobacterales bacterium]|nr:type IV toxin-antitoxin system AbiEi family antitoxin domain-containing protein [Desulfobacterales bacterium]
MRQNQEQRKKVIALVKKGGVLRPRDLDRYGITRVVLQRLRHDGIVERVGHGLYRPVKSTANEQMTMMEVCKRVSHGVICLLSALRYYDLTTQAPFEIWLAIDVKARKPQTDLPIRIVRFSGQAFSEGVENHKVDGVTIKVYKPAKTVADCFKYRNKIGLDVALESLRECLKARRCTMDELWYYAKICRVSNVMRPYLDAMTI